MSSYILRRLVQSLPILIGISIVVFIMLQLVPGDPINALVPPDKQDVVDLDAVRRQYGLDKPLPEQYVYMIKGIITGDIVSFSQRVPAMDIIGKTLPVTALIGLSAMLISVPVGIGLGLIASRRPFGIFDQIMSVTSLGGISMPSFVIALILIYFLTEIWGVLPASGIRPPGTEGWGLAMILPHMIMPVLTLTCLLIPEFYRFTRSSMLDILSEDYLRTARAKGVAEMNVFMKHALRNALLPVVTMIGLNIPYVLAGSVLLETVFAIPGMGRLAVTAALARDYPLIMATNMIAATIVIGSNLLTDIMYAVIDPRVKLS